MIPKRRSAVVIVTSDLRGILVVLALHSWHGRLIDGVKWMGWDRGGIAFVYRKRLA